jgi:hypothetical protein
MKKTRSILLACIVVLAFPVTFFLIRYPGADPHIKEKRASLMSLADLREKITYYHKAVGQFPSSLAQMEAYFVDHPGAGRGWRPSKEHISMWDGNGRESAVLDGRGGWYYNGETGEVRINLNKCLKGYFKHYYRLDRYDRPCDW